MSGPQARAFGHVSPSEVCAELKAGARLRLVDVREPLEHRLASIEGAELIPLGELSSRLDQLGRDEDIVVICHHGIRSAAACSVLARSGFHRIRNMSGGIDRWSRDVDPSVPRY